VKPTPSQGGNIEAKLWPNSGIVFLRLRRLLANGSATGMHMTPITTLIATVITLASGAPVAIGRTFASWGA
jgi:hypothetical protein